MFARWPLTVRGTIRGGGAASAPRNASRLAAAGARGAGAWSTAAARSSQAPEKGSARGVSAGAPQHRIRPPRPLMTTRRGVRGASSAENVLAVACGASWATCPLGPNQATTDEEADDTPDALLESLNTPLDARTARRACAGSRGACVESRLTVKNISLAGSVAPEGAAPPFGPLRVSGPQLASVCRP